MLNVYEQVDRNRHRSAIVIAGFIIFVSTFIWALGKLLGSNSDLIILALLVSIASALIGYYKGDALVLAASHAKPASKNEFPNFFRAAQNLAIVAQIPLPRLYVIDTPAMNAFATGRDPRHAAICATRGLLENLNQSELEAVIGHETGHVVDYDIRLMTIVAILVGSIVLVSNWILRSGLFWGRGDNDDRGAGALISIALSLLLLIVAPLVATLIKLAISRRREFLADAMSVKFTRQPKAMINALRKISHQTIGMKNASPALAHLYIVNPFKGGSSFNRRLNGLFSTHPPIGKRINALEKML